MNGELLARTLKTRQPSAEGRGRGGAAAAGAPGAAARSGTACPPPLVPRSGRGRGCGREPEPQAARRPRASSPAESPALACRRRGPGRLWRAVGRPASRGSGAAERGRRGGRRTQEPEPPPPPPASNLRSRRLPPTRPSPATYSPRLTSRAASEQKSGG